MPVLTGRQRALAAEAPKPEVSPRADVQGTPPAGPSPLVRMHHPDDPYHRMCVSMTVDGFPGFEVKDGIATVPEGTAKELERRGWLRGSEVKEDA